MVLSPALRLFREKLPGYLQLDVRWSTFVVAADVGIAVGLGTALFTYIFKIVDRVIKGIMATDFEQYIPPEGDDLSTIVVRSLTILGLMAVAGILSGVLNRWLPTFSRKNEIVDFGTNAVIHSFNGDSGELSSRSALVKTLIGSPVLLGAGGAAGIEGTVAYLGGGIGTLYGKVWKGMKRNYRMLAICGASAAIGAVFHAPLGAAIYMAEVLYFSSDMETGYIAHSVIAAVLGYAVYTSIHGHHALFNFGTLAFSLHDIGYTFLLSLFIIPFSYLFTAIFRRLSRWFQSLPVSIVLKPLLGLSLAAVLLLIFPYSGGVGYGYVQNLINGQYTIPFVLVFIVVKVLLISLTVGSGGNGGLFGPSIVIGAMLGGLFVLIARIAGVELSMGTYVVLGMAAFLSATENTPVSAIIMISEITGSYLLLVPLSLASMTAFFLGRRSVLYGSQVGSRLESSAHFGSYINLNQLRKTTVKEILVLERKDVPVIKASESVEGILGIAEEHAGINLFPVLHNDELQGFIDITTFREDIDLVVEDPLMRNLIIAEDVVRNDLYKVPASEVVYSLLVYIKAHEGAGAGVETFPVINDDGTFAGLIRYQDIVNQQVTLFNRHLVEGGEEEE